jgi:hypothetical protein
MASAAMHALYSNMAPMNISYNQLSNSDIKKIVAQLCNYPSEPNTISSEKYWKDLREDIKRLPSYLKSHKLNNLLFSEDKYRGSKGSKLCPGHIDLNHNLINTFWENIRAEFEGGIGPFLYPLIMEAGLTRQAESKVRQLEPVSEMWCKDFNIYDHTPDGCDPLRPEEMVNGTYLAKWRRQNDECPGCLLARIGSDKQVLFALLAGMVGRYSARATGKKSDIKSKRIHFVHYWLRQRKNGEKAVEEAWELGEELKRLHKLLKEHRKGKQSSSFYGPRERPSNALEGGHYHHPSSLCQDFEHDVCLSDYYWPSNMATVSDVDIYVLEPLSSLDGDYCHPRDPAILGSGYGLTSNRSSSIYDGRSGQQNCPRTPAVPCSHSCVQEVAGSHPSYQHSHAESVGSQRSSFSNDEGKWEWETPASSIGTFDTTLSEQLTHDYREHLSMVPPPLQTRPFDGKAFLEVPRSNCKPFYASFGDSNEHPEYDVSSSDMRIADHSHGSKRGHNISPPSPPYGNPLSTRRTEWSNFY